MQCASVGQWPAGDFHKKVGIAGRSVSGGISHVTPVFALPRTTSSVPTTTVVPTLVIVICEL